MRAKLLAAVLLPVLASVWVSSIPVNRGVHAAPRETQCVQAETSSGKARTDGVNGCRPAETGTSSEAGCEQPEEASGKPRGEGPGCKPDSTVSTQVPVTATPEPTQVPLPTETPLPPTGGQGPVSTATRPAGRPAATATPVAPLGEDVTALAPAAAPPAAVHTALPEPTSSPPPALRAEVLGQVSASRLQTAPAAPAAPPAVADEPVTEEPAPAILVQAPAPVRPTPGPPAPVSVSIPATEAIFDAVPGFFELSTSLAVIGTNLLFSLLVLLCLLLATTLFNSTLKENQAVLAAGSMAVLTPILKARESVTGFGWPGASFLARLKPLRAGLFLFATAGIYGALDPSFGWNTNSAILYISLATGLAATTFLYEGAAVFLSSRRFGMAAEMKVFPLALLIAAGSVLLSRITGFHPGVIFGFVSAAAISGSSNARHQGLVVWLPLCGLFAVSLLALVLISPLRDWGDQQGGAWSALPETIAVAVFVGGAQSVVLTLMPVTFNDGHRIWMWSKFAWLALSLPACFIFFHALVNSEADLADLSARSNFGLILAASAGVLLLSVVVWLFFKVRSRSVAQADGASG